MRAAWTVAAIWACCSSADAADLRPPIAAAAQGQLQCYAPNTARKTCQSLAAYKLSTDGTIENIAIVLISQSPAITMRTMSPVEIKADQVCGPIRAQDIEAASFTVGDHIADPAQTTLLRQKMEAAIQGMIGHEVCTAYIPDSGALLAKATVDGVPQPTMDQRVIWVSSADGYSVAP